MYKKESSSKIVTIEDVSNYWNNSPMGLLEFQTPNNKTDFELIDNLRWSENEFYVKRDFYDLPGNSKTRLLDAGCGIGVFTRFYARLGFKVTALDITDRAIQITKKSLELNNLTAEVLQGSVEDLPFSDNSFDYVISNGVIHHTPKTKKAIHEFYRVLKPGGKASIAINYKNWLLRNPFFPIVKLLTPLLKYRHKNLNKNLRKVRTAKDFAKLYDENVPISKIYTKKQARTLYHLFSILKQRPHYFPIRLIQIGGRRITSGSWLHYLLDKYCGCMLYALLEKPLEAPKHILTS